MEVMRRQRKETIQDELLLESEYEFLTLYTIPNLVCIKLDTEFLTVFKPSETKWQNVFFLTNGISSRTVYCWFAGILWRGGGVAPIPLVGNTWSFSTGSILFTYALQYRFCHHNYMILCCEYSVHNIYCMSVWEFFLILIKDLRTDGVVCCTDCKVPWGKL